MTKPERLLAVAGVAVVASAALLVMYVRDSNPADAHAAGCATQRARLGQTLDQVRFSTSAAHAVAMALKDTAKTRDQYAGMIAAMRRQLPSSRLPQERLAAVRDDLAQASWILNGQSEPLQHAQSLLDEDQRQLESATPLIAEASADIREEDCPALSLTLSRSGWPKDRLIAELSDAARVNSQVSERLDAALVLIVRAQSRSSATSIAIK